MLKHILFTTLFMFFAACAAKSPEPQALPTDTVDASDTGDTGTAGAVLPSPGVQLYTVRDAMAADFEGTLRALYDIGYRQVEFAGYFDHSPSEVKSLLAKLKMTSPSVHFSVEDFRDPQTMLNLADAAGHKTVVLAWLPESLRTEAGFLETAALLNTAAALAAPMGIQVAYHNHDFEFAPIGDTTGFALLMRDTAPAVKVELDVYWSTFAGVALDSFVAEYPGRIALCHLKDMDGNKEMQDVGSGVLDWRAIIPTLTAAGCNQFYVEHDNPEDGLLSVQNSYRFLTGPGIENRGPTIPF
jgi:sugar phosphate isomerase/epimerase